MNTELRRATAAIEREIKPLLDQGYTVTEALAMLDAAKRRVADRRAERATLRSSEGPGTVQTIFENYGSGGGGAGGFTPREGVIPVATPDLPSGKKDSHDGYGTGNRTG